MNCSLVVEVDFAFSVDTELLVPVRLLKGNPLLMEMPGQRKEYSKDEIRNESKSGNFLFLEFRDRDQKVSFI